MMSNDCMFEMSICINRTASPGMAGELTKVHEWLTDGNRLVSIYCIIPSVRTLTESKLRMDVHTAQFNSEWLNRGSGRVFNALSISTYTQAARESSLLPRAVSPKKNPPKKPPSYCHSQLVFTLPG